MGTENANKREEKADAKLKAAKREMGDLEARVREDGERIPPILKPNNRFMESMQGLLLSAMKSVQFPAGIPRDLHVAMDAAAAAIGAEESRAAEEESQEGSEISDEDMHDRPAEQGRGHAERPLRSAWAKGKAKGKDREQPVEERQGRRSRSPRARADWADEEHVDDIMDNFDNEDKDNVAALADIARRLKRPRQL